MGNNIFCYLENDYPDLYSLAIDIDQLVFSAPHTVVVKSRVFIEVLSKEIAKLEDLHDLIDLNLAQRLYQLKFHNVLDAEYDKYFNDTRKIGNQAAHEEIENEIISALLVHKNIYKITGWFIENYIDFKFVTPIYKNPRPLQHGEQQANPTFFKELMEKMESLINRKKDTTIRTLNENVEIKEDVKIQIATKEIVHSYAKSECLVDELSKLKESSREAVEGLNEFTSFKQYMHIDRNAQKELEQIILAANNQENSQLILVCGSVGDGKSHIISYFKNRYPEIIKNFTLYNDATESLEPNKTSMDTLNDLLDNFSDEKIQTSTQKVILAINLGTLNNFIDSNYGKRFTILKNFVSEKKILEKSIADNKFDSQQNIQYVNFSDYSLYTLKDEKVESEYIKTLIKKITDKSELNIFYQSYQTNCMKCKNINKCPIKANYELLSEEKTQSKLIDLLVQAIIKKKIIISTRALLNFMYDILIPRSSIDIHSPMFKDDISKLKINEYTNALTPNIIFDHEELSFIFKALNTLDPLNIRNKEVDDFIIKFNNSNNLIDFFDQYIDYPKNYISPLVNINNEEKIDKKIRKELLKLFIRSYYLCGKGEIFNLSDQVYEDFIKYVYYWNKGEKAKLKELYTQVKDGIFKWNGEADKNQINIFIGKNQVKYKISEYLELKADASNLPINKENRLEKFLSTIEIKYRGEGLDISYGIEIDYPLYELLIRVGNGYRPNKKDKNHFIKFIEFINKIELAGSQKTELTFTEKNREKNKSYKLEYDEEFEIYKFMEI